VHSKSQLDCRNHLPHPPPTLPPTVTVKHSSISDEPGQEVDGYINAKNLRKGGVENAMTNVNNGPNCPN